MKRIEEIHETFFTPRQLEFLAMSAEGFTVQEVADAFFVAPDTVKEALGDARRRAGARNTTHLVAIAMAAGRIAYRED